MTPAQLVTKLLGLPSELMHVDIWLDGTGYLETVKDYKHGPVLSVIKEPNARDDSSTIS